MHSLWARRFVILATGLRLVLVLSVKPTHSPLRSPTAQISRRQLLDGFTVGGRLGLALPATVLVQRAWRTPVSNEWHGSSAAQRAATVFCDGPLLDAVQRSNIFGDSKGDSGACAHATLPVPHECARRALTELTHG